MAAVDRIALQLRVDKRRKDLMNAANELIAHEMMRRDDGHPEIVLDEVQLYRATEGYFLISEAYKNEFGIKQTEPPKIAAMTALSLSKFAPLRLVARDNVQSRFAPFANEILSLMWAARPLGQDFSVLIENSLRSEGLYRFCRTLRKLNVHCLDEFQADLFRNPPTPRAVYEIRLDHDTVIQESALSSLPHIELMILIFELIWDGKNRISD